MLRRQLVSDAAAKFDIPGGEENTRRRDLFHNKGPYGVAFPERQDTLTLRQLNARRAPFGLRVPRGSKDTDIGNPRFCDPGQIHRCLAPDDFGDGGSGRDLSHRRSGEAERVAFRI